MKFELITAVALFAVFSPEMVFELITMPPEIISNDFVFFGIIQQIRIRFSSSRIFFVRFEFLVCS